MHNRQGERSDRVKLEDLIFSEKYGRKSFNIDVDERKQCLEAIYNNNDYDVSNEPESVRNIKARYQDIEKLFPDEINDEALPYFVDWLIENVYLVEITAYSDEDAYTIFETMNDRGLSLNPLEMLKGYLLANISDEAKRYQANQTWKKRISSLADFGKDEDADAFKAWFRGQYAESIRERKKGAQPKDFDRLGTEFHRWVRENREKIGPELHSDEFQHESDFAEYRHRIGGLLLLPKSFNASYGDLPYKEKLKHYFSQNLLARSLHPNCYQHNPGFLYFINSSKLPFRPHPDFKRADLDARQALYQRIAECLWDSRRLEQEAQL